MEKSARSFRVVYVALIVCILVIFIGVYVCYFNWTTTVLLVRHAERADLSQNTNLSPAGLARAQALVEVAEEAGVAAIYTTEYCRTAQTAMFLADDLGLPIRVQRSNDPTAGLDGCDPPIAVPVNELPAQVVTPEELVARLLDEHRNQVVLVVGHSNSVPLMVQALGGGELSPVEIGHDEFDRLFIVSLRRFFGSPRLVKARYGG